MKGNKQEKQLFNRTAFAASMIIAVASALLIGTLLGAVFSDAAERMGLLASAQAAVRTLINPEITISDPLSEEQFNQILEKIEAGDPTLTVDKGHFEVAEDGTLEYWVPFIATYSHGPNDVIKLIFEDGELQYGWQERVIGSNWMNFGLTDQERIVNLQIQKYNTETGEYVFSENVELTIPSFEEGLAIWENQK